MNQTEDVIEIDLQEIFGLLLSKIWLLILCGVTAALAGFCISNFIITPKYESTTKIYILNKQDNNTITYSDMQLGTQLTKDYAQLITSRDVLERVIEDCELEETYEEFAERVEVENITDTRIIAISVLDVEPEMAQELANEIRVVAAEHIKQVMDIQAVNVAEEANLPEEPASPSVLKWTLIGLCLGVFLCVAVVILKFVMDDTVKTSEDVEKYLGLSTLAMIPVMEDEVQRSGKHRRKYYDVDLEAENSAQNEDVEVMELESVKVHKEER